MDKHEEFGHQDQEQDALGLAEVREKKVFVV